MPAGLKIIKEIDLKPQILFRTSLQNIKKACIVTYLSNRKQK